MAIFKKLSVGDIVATSGARAFRKLSTELPIWNGVDLTGTAWVLNETIDLVSLYNIPTDDIVGEDSFYGERHYYNVNYFYGNSSLPNTKIGVFTSKFNNLEYGLFYADDDYSSICPYGTNGWEYQRHRNIRITGGTDATNPLLISWLLENGELTSHTVPEPELPIWNGTDLTGTTWRISGFGLTAEAGYGEFDVLGKYVSSSVGTLDFYNLCIGYRGYNSQTYEADIHRATADYVCWNIVYPSGVISYKNVYKTEDDGGFASSSCKLTFTSGADVTNPRLIDWLLQNAELTSHRLVINGTYRLNDTITELPIVYADGENISQQTCFNVDFFKVNGSPKFSLFCLQETDGITLLAMPTLSANYLYDFRTSTWRKDELRNFTFNNAIAKNDIGEDVTPILLVWITNNATKQDSI